MKYGPLSEFLDQNSDSNLVNLEELFFFFNLFLPIQDLSAQFVLVTGSIIKQVNKKLTEF
jgi:hypothetical protein